MLEVRLPRQNWDREKLEPIYHSIQSAAELGFVFKASIKDLVRDNTFRGSLWGVYEDDILKGACLIGSRALYQHMARHGDINVFPEYRRHRLGTTLYTVQILQAILEGRRCVEDTIVPALSPWMAGPTECGGGFLNSLKYQFYGTLPERTRSFKDIQLWGKSTLALQDYLDRLPKTDIVFELRETPVVRETYMKNMAVYEQYMPGVAREMSALRDFVLSFAKVQIVTEREQQRDAGGNWAEVKA